MLYVHGGPWARDTWGYDPTAQWLANRGYLCVQVNYRGSSGYGKAFLNAGDREWGRRMHEDLIDAVEHVVGLGFADRSRVGIYGGSYGGYAALVGATFTPDVFRCAVDVVGPVEPAHAARDDPAVLEAARLAVPSPGRPPRDATSTSCGSARRSRAWPTSASRS